MENENYLVTDAEEKEIARRIDAVGLGYDDLGPCDSIVVRTEGEMVVLANDGGETAPMPPKKALYILHRVEKCAAEYESRLEAFWDISNRLA